MGIYVFSELAVQDLDEICEFIAQADVSAVTRLFDAIRKKSGLTQLNPILAP